MYLSSSTHQNGTLTEIHMLDFCWVVVNTLFGRVCILSNYIRRNVFLRKLVILKNSTNVCHDCQIIFTRVLLRASQTALSDLLCTYTQPVSWLEENCQKHCVLSIWKRLENCFLCNVQAWGWRNMWTLSTEYYRSLRGVTKSMEQSPSWEDYRFLVSQEFPHILWGEEIGSLPYSQEHVTCPCSELDQSSPCPHLTSWTSISILYFHLRPSIPNGFFYQVSTPAPWITSDLPSMCHLPHLSHPWLIIWIIFGEDTDHEACHYALFFTPLLPVPP